MNQSNTKKIKIEFRIIITCIIIVAGILVLITNNPDEIILVSSLENINQHALDAKEFKNKDKLDSYKPIMQRQLQKIVSSNLGISIEIIYLKEDWNFPFRDSFKIKPH